MHVATFKEIIDMDPTSVILSTGYATAVGLASLLPVLGQRGVTLAYKLGTYEGLMMSS